MIPLYADIRIRRLPFFTLAIIALNVVIFAGWQMRVGLRASVFAAGLIPGDLAESGPVDDLAHLFTYMFLHGGWMHLLGNMWFLWIFGQGVEDDMGSRRFLVFYLVCGIAAAMTHAAFSHSAWMPLVGASGAISGVLGAYLVLYPAARIITLVPIIIIIRIIAVPAPLFLLVWIGLQVLAQANSHQPAGVAYLAHIGGFLCGLALIPFFRK